MQPNAKITPLIWIKWLQSIANGEIGSTESVPKHAVGEFVQIPARKESRKVLAEFALERRLQSKNAILKNALVLQFSFPNPNQEFLLIWCCFHKIWHNDNFVFLLKRFIVSGRNGWKETAQRHAELEPEPTLEISLWLKSMVELAPENRLNLKNVTLKNAQVQTNF